MATSISPAGIVEDMMSMGFSYTDSICELIENPLDANASKIEIHINTDHILIIDNASGLNEDKLIESKRLFDRKTAKDSKNGCFGCGGSIACAKLTNGEKKAIRISKMQTTPIFQLTVDYPKILRTDTYTFSPHEASVRFSKLWDDYAIDKNHGTIDFIECPDHIRDRLLMDITTVKWGRMYNDYIVKGITISFYNEGTLLFSIQPEDISNIADATHYEMYCLDVWKNSDGKIITQVGKEKDGPDGYYRIGNVDCTSSIRYVKDCAHNWKKEDGGQFLKRGRKIVDCVAIKRPGKGDFAEQNIIQASKHVWKYSTSLDVYMGTEINKSHIDIKNIHPEILKPLEEMSKQFSKNFYKRVKSAPVQKVKKRVFKVEKDKDKDKDKELEPDLGNVFAGFIVRTNVINIAEFLEKLKNMKPEELTDFIYKLNEFEKSLQQIMHN